MYNRTLIRTASVTLAAAAFAGTQVAAVATHARTLHISAKLKVTVGPPPVCHAGIRAIHNSGTGQMTHFGGSRSRRGSPPTATSRPAAPALSGSTGSPAPFTPARASSSCTKPASSARSPGLGHASTSSGPSTALTAPASSPALTAEATTPPTPPKTPQRPTARSPSRHDTAERCIHETRTNSGSRAMRSRTWIWVSILPSALMQRSRRHWNCTPLGTRRNQARRERRTRCLDLDSDGLPQSRWLPRTSWRGR
jgi:hypothetical protein